MKRCTKCKQIRPLNEFSRNNSSPDGLQSHCKTCRAAAYAIYYAANREKEKARSAAYHAAHPEKSRARSAKYNRVHPEKVKARHAAYRAAHRKERNAYSAAYNKKYRNYPLDKPHRPVLQFIAQEVGKDDALTGCKHDRG